VSNNATNPRKKKGENRKFGLDKKSRVSNPLAKIPNRAHKPPVKTTNQKRLLFFLIKFKNLENF